MIENWNLISAPLWRSQGVVVLSPPPNKSRSGLHYCSYMYTDFCKSNLCELDFWERNFCELNLFKLDFCKLISVNWTFVILDQIRLILVTDFCWKCFKVVQFVKRNYYSKVNLFGTRPTSVPECGKVLSFSKVTWLPKKCFHL